MKKSSLWILGAACILVAVIILASLPPKMRTVEYVVYLTPSSDGNIVIHYEDKAIRPKIDSGNTIAVHDLRNMARVVVPTQSFKGSPWRKTVELPAGSHAHAEARAEDGSKHKDLAISIHVDGEWKSSFHSDNSDSILNGEFID